MKYDTASEGGQSKPEAEDAGLKYPYIEENQGIFPSAADPVKDTTTPTILQECQVHYMALNVRLSFFVIVICILTK